ncbi:MAG TPA: hypothetical protein VFM25_13965, partial [Verrucomicrobiae bacterium]|nr:hypothetical protein [Verrucomicrobiae bacterium]
NCRRRAHAPFHFYRGDDGRRHFAWALTGNEEIFQHFDRERLSLFQWYLIQWIEIENRAMKFLDENDLHERCFTLHAPGDLNHPEKIQALFDFLNLEALRPEPVLRGRTNKSLGQTTVITPDDEHECDSILEKMPARYFEIFNREPYSQYNWSARLRREMQPNAAKTQLQSEVSC